MLERVSNAVTSVSGLDMKAKLETAIEETIEELAEEYMVRFDICRVTTVAMLILRLDFSAIV